jgi:hypothetical protein
MKVSLIVVRCMPRFAVRGDVLGRGSAAGGPTVQSVLPERADSGLWLNHPARAEVSTDG